MYFSDAPKKSLL